MTNFGALSTPLLKRTEDDRLMSTLIPPLSASRRNVLDYPKGGISTPITLIFDWNPLVVVTWIT